MFKRVITIISVVLLFISCSQQKIVSEGEALLTQKLEENSQQTYDFEIVLQSTTVFQGNTQTSTLNIDYQITNTIKDMKNDTLVVTTVFDKIDGSIKTSQGMQQLPGTEELQGKEIQITLYPDGNTILSGEFSDDENQILKLMKSSIIDLYGFLPQRMVKVGENWTKDLDLEEVSSKNIYTLTGFSQSKDWGKVNIIESKSEISQESDMTKNGTDIHSENSGTASSTIHCTADKGLVTKIKSHAALEGTAELSGNPMIGDMTIPNYMNMDTVIERIK